MLHSPCAMNFSQFIEEAWAIHATKTNEVGENIRRLVAETNGVEHISALASLITHVFGEHLGQWTEAIDLLQKLQMQAETAEARHTLFLNITALRLAGGQLEKVDDLLKSDQIRVLCVAGSALLGQHQVDRAGGLYLQALRLAESQISKSDPAHRSLAVTGNNVAAYLEEKGQRAPSEVELMVRCARAALKHWTIAGKWNHQQMAHYRLSKCLLAAGMEVEALEEAMSCMALCKINGAGFFDLFWANEALASATKTSKNEAAREYVMNMRDLHQRMDPEERVGCQKRLRDLEAAVL